MLFYLLVYQHVFGEVTPMFCHRGIESVGFGYSVQSFSLVVHISPVLCLACERVTERGEEREGDEEGRQSAEGRGRLTCMGAKIRTYYCQLGLT